jgi:hypothetical protein
LSGDNTADDSIDEFKSRATRQGLKLNPAITKLAVTAGLLFMPSLYANLFLDGFAIGNFGGSDNTFDIEFALEFFNGGFNVNLAGTGK